MATIAAPITADPKEVESQFNALAAHWREETGMLSSTTARSTHPAYQRIIGMGPAVLPVLFRELQKDANGWFWALTAITGENPVAPKHRGQQTEMAQDWLRWARARGYL